MASPPGAGSRADVGGPGTKLTDEEASLHLILSIGRAFKYVDDYVRPRMLQLGLTMTEFSVLNVLYRSGPTPLGELSDRILLTGASTTYTVKKLEERKLMLRQRLPGDNRVVMGSITDTGRELLDRVRPLHTEHLVEAMRALSAAEKQAATALLRKLQSEPRGER